MVRVGRGEQMETFLGGPKEVPVQQRHKKFMKDVIKVAVTGAAGQLGYALLYRLASGEMFGHEQPIELHLIELPSAMTALSGIAMELEDCAFPLLKKVVITDNLKQGFDGVNWALLIGSVPRKQGMERKDLLGINGKIFVDQGKAIEENAAADVRILVVGNPCNTNCLIAMNHAKSIPSNRWFAMTRLDENRAKTQLALKAGVSVDQVTNMTIWGNHSTTQFPDFYNAKINGQLAFDVIRDESWLKDTFLSTVQKRGAAILKARGFSSAASASSAIIDTVVSLTTPTKNGDWHSVAVPSDGSYGIEEGIVCSLPIRTNGKNYEIIQGLPLNDFSKQKIAVSIAELKEEKGLVFGENGF